MNKRLRSAAGFVLVIYCFLLLAASSPLHLYLDKLDKTTATGYPSIPLNLPNGANNKSSKVCPLCVFLSLIFTLGGVSIFFILEAARYFILNAKYEYFYLPSIRCYYSLAPPANIP